MTCSFRLLSTSMVLGVLAGTPAANAATNTEKDLCANAYGMIYREPGVEARPVFERFICQLRIDKPAKVEELAGPATGIDFLPPLNINFHPLANAALADVAITAELVDTINFTAPPKIDFAAFSNLAQPASMTVGENAVWLVTPGGLRVFDAKSKRWSFTPKVSTEQVRPKDVILDSQGGSVWLFGKDLYQYEMAAHRIYRYKAPAKLFHVIRKVAPVANGLWLATDGGAFFFDTKRKALQQLQADSKPVTLAFSQVAAGRSGVWFASGEAHLLRIQRNSDRLSVQMSGALGGLPPIELVARDSGLWMLHTQDQGRSYQLATVSASDLALTTSRARLYSLRETDGQMLASAYDKLFRVDTENRKLVQVNADIAAIGSLALGKRVLFSGVSYVNSRSTGSVGRYVLDLSKGWQQPASRIMFEGWSSKQSSDIFAYLPALLETGVNQREVWFLIADNLGSPRFDRTVAARYDKRSGRAEVFFSRWTKGTEETQHFAVESLATTVYHPD